MVGAHDARRSTDGREDALRLLDDVRVEVEPLPPLVLPDPGQDFFLRLLAEPLEPHQAILDAGVLQLADRADAQVVIDRLQLLGAKSGNRRHVQQAGGEGSLQLLMHGGPPRRDKLCDRALQGLADPLDVAQETLLHQDSRLLREALDHPRPSFIRLDLERILAFQFQEKGDLLKDGCDFTLGHNQQFILAEPSTQCGTVGARRAVPLQPLHRCASWPDLLAC